MLVVTFTTIRAEDLDDTLYVGRERSRLADSLSFLDFEAKPATIEINLEDQAL